MIRSMTGFARRERQFPWGLLAWELKTVNHRFLEIGCRLPEEFRSGEAEFRAAIAAAVRRGKVECSLHFGPRWPRPRSKSMLNCSRASPRGRSNRRAGRRRVAHRCPRPAALARRDPRRHA